MQEKIYDLVSFQGDRLARKIKNYLDEVFKDESEAILYYKEPDYATPTDILPTFTVCSKKYGIFVFIYYDYTSELLTEINDKFWIIKGNKTKNKILDFQDYCFKLDNDIKMPSNEIYEDIKIHKYVLFPLISSETISVNLKRQNVTLLFEDFNGYKLLKDIPEVNIDNEDWSKMLSVIQKSNILTKETEYIVDTPISNVRDAIAYNNQQISLFDEDQLDASMTITEGAQRIRGLAGSGKTVILSIKAARLHRKYKDAKIIYAFSTQSLYNQVTKLVNKYYSKLTGEKINPDKLEIIHAWGGKYSGPGVYYNICLSNGIKPLTVRDLYGYPDKFEEACNRLLTNNLKQEYDYILVDEAQDMPVSFFKLLEKVTKPPKNIIWAYDDLQTINSTKIPEPKELFGVNNDGSLKVPLLPSNDYILKKSYRNHKDVLMSALAFGFGMYSKNDFVQIIKEKSTWESLGFFVEKGLEFGEETIITRPTENSPNKIDQEFKSLPIVNKYAAVSTSEELEVTAKHINHLIYNELVKPEDIMVVDLQRDSKKRLATLQNYLYSNNILSVMPGLVEGAKDFMRENHVTLTTVRRAKGNEVPIVFVLGCEKIYLANSLYEKRTFRNMLFVAMTRAKGWLYLSGQKDVFNLFQEEVKKMWKDIQDGYYKFDFPTEEDFKSIEKLNLLTLDGERSEKLQNQADQLADILGQSDVSELEMFMDEETLKKLENLILRGKSKE
ncbi:hypothetical protein PB01_19460 [Psychrobacillus glaciei]|uniref:Uncharacterized protein n=1 Tax=Psychrobacillus glaciei TaxID=2283160 RepID=A0A5J6SWQ2_9BACI|nr:ATP-binding domain-containing protein [Psychrobacillus glaciei]QFG00798.1 hypothetical protein PB01_19460 [Psychrobacillus glaciei]